VFRVEMLPAGNGDCLWVEYGSAREVHRILIDAGRASTYEALRARILALPAAERVFELLVVTHIDNDHIEGIIPLLQDTGLGCTFRDVWYNGWRHLEGLPGARPPQDILGAREGEFLGVLVEDAGLCWNQSFDSAMVVVPTVGDLPVRELEGGMRLTLLSPTIDRLVALRDVWQTAIEDAGFLSGDRDAIKQQLLKRRYLSTPADLLGVQQLPAGRDNSAANGASIGFLAEHDGVRALFTGDGFASVFEASLARLGASPCGPLKVDLWKLAHHGSWQNFTPALLALVSSTRYLISTNGSGSSKHPHEKTLDYIIENHPGRGRPELIFNYRTPTTERWASAHTSQVPYTATYPAGAVVLL
jgi:hypothetical protein